MVLRKIVTALTRTIREFVAFLDFLVQQSLWSYLSKVHAEHVERQGGVNTAVSGASLQGHVQGVLFLGFSIYFFFQGWSSVREFNQSSCMNCFHPTRVELPES